MSRMGSQVSFHESHCPNYRLFVVQSNSSENPFAVQIEHVDSTVVAERIDLNKPFTMMSDDVESTSALSARIADNRSNKSGLEPVNMIDRENCEWVNDLLAVLYEAWTNAKVFHDLVLASIYNAVNDGREDSLAEIKVKAL